MNKNTKDQLIRDITVRTLANLDCNMNTKGAKCLAEAMVILNNNYSDCEPFPVSNLRIDIACKLKLKEYNVERTIRHLFNSLDPSNPYYEEVFGETTNFKQANMINLLYKYISDRILHVDLLDKSNDDTSLIEAYQKVKSAMFEFESILMGKK